MALSTSQAERVLLGFKDAVLDGKASSWMVSKIGGVPDPVPHVKLSYPSCPLCSSLLCHVVQVYCPLEGSRYHRVIHVFACSTKQCWGKPQSWVALRSQCLETQNLQVTKEMPKQENKMAATDWCADADDWGFDEDESGTPAIESHATTCPAVPVPTDWTSQLQNLSLTDASETLPSCDSVFKSYFISVVEEDDCAWDTDLDHAFRLLKDYEKQEDAVLENLESCEGQGEKYEKSHLEKQDTVFHKFLKKISLCREQILRYSWNGNPLYMSSPDAASQPPLCLRCGAQRVFEFQLMPALVSMLQGSKPDMMLEFGSILIFTCERSCWEEDGKIPFQEFCIVQEDPDQRYFN